MTVTLSLLGVPTIDRAGLFPLMNPVFDFTYRNPTNAIHLYDYYCRVRVDSQEYVVSPGDITCIQNGSVYSLSAEEPGKHWCVHYYDTPSTDSESFEVPVYIGLGANSHFYREQLQLISQLSRSHGVNDDTNVAGLEARFRLKSLLLSLCSLANGQRHGRRSSNNFSWERVLEWIDDNLSESISSSMLAEQVNLASGTFARKFRQAHRMTVSQYLLHRRVSKAKALLATTTLTVCDVGNVVGIPDPQYFNKQFRRITGMSPSRYRDDNQEYLSNVTDEMATMDGRWLDRESASST